MALDRNELRSLINKIPKINKSEALHPDSRLLFLYFQLMERKKILWRSFVQAQTAVTFAKEDDRNANDQAIQVMNEATAQMRALKWEIKSLNEQIRTHIALYGDVSQQLKDQEGIPTEGAETDITQLVKLDDDEEAQPAPSK